MSVKFGVSREAKQVVVVKTVSGLMGNTTKRTIRGVGLLFNLPRDRKLRLIPVFP